VKSWSQRFHSNKELHQDSKSIKKIIVQSTKLVFKVAGDRWFRINIYIQDRNSPALYRACQDDKVYAIPHVQVRVCNHRAQSQTIVSVPLKRGSPPCVCDHLQRIRVLLTRCGRFHGKSEHSFTIVNIQTAIEWMESFRLLTQVLLTQVLLTQVLLTQVLRRNPSASQISDHNQG